MTVYKLVLLRLINLLANNPWSPQEYLCKRLQKKCKCRTMKGILSWLGGGGEGPFDSGDVSSLPRFKEATEGSSQNWLWKVSGLVCFPCSFLLAVPQQRTAFWTDSGSHSSNTGVSPSAETTEGSSQSRLWWVLSFFLFLPPRHPLTAKCLLNSLRGSSLTRASHRHRQKLPRDPVRVRCDGSRLFPYSFLFTVPR